MGASPFSTKFSTPLFARVENPAFIVDNCLAQVDISGSPNLHVTQENR